MTNPNAPAPMTTTNSTPPVTSDRPWIRQALIVLLAINSGAIDAIGFMALGGAFSSVMTGNMVLIGISAAHGDGALARTVGVSLLCFVAGCAIGARIAGRAELGDRIWPAAIRRALAVELVLIVAVLAGWELAGWELAGWEPAGATGAGTGRSAAVKLALLGANAVALGVQSSAMQRFGVAGLSTTYLTGTLTTVVSRLALREPVRQIGSSASILAGLVAGAVLGALLALHAAPWAPLLPVTLVGTAVIVPLLIWKDTA